jgi:Uma2 family endonuclease
MSTSTIPAIPTPPARPSAPTPPSPTPENRLVLYGIDWTTYDGLLKLFEGRRLRITYDRGVLEMMTTSARHERFKTLLARLFETLTEELNIPVLGLGAFTCRREDLDRGLEPDECWYIQHESEMRARREIDLDEDPPPDLVIEVEVSRSVLNRLGIYAALGVPEIWRHDGETVHVLRLNETNEYVPVEASVVVPPAPLAVMVQFLALRDQLGETGVVRAFRAWVRENLLGPAAP